MVSAVCLLAFPPIHIVSMLTNAVEGRHFLNMSKCNCNFGSRLSAADEGSEVFIFLSAQFLHATVVWVIVLNAVNTYFLCLSIAAGVKVNLLSQFSVNVVFS